VEHRRDIGEVDRKSDHLLSPAVGGELEEECVADPRDGVGAGLGEVGVEARADKVGALQVRQPNVAEESPELGMACRRERHAG
jgi:hypothetical protein